MGRVLQVITVIATSFEFLLATSLLALFASAYPDQFRTALWRDGGSKGWNSDPSDRIYLYANYEEVPPMPLIWDEGSTQYNLYVAIITMVLWFVRLCIRGRTLDIYGAVVSNVLYDIISIALWSYSAIIQTSGDFSDPKHISQKAWYLEHGCKEAWLQNHAACRLMKASFALTISAIVWFGIRCITSLMYGAYTYGKSFEDTELLCPADEKTIHRV